MSWELFNSFSPLLWQKIRRGRGRQKIISFSILFLTLALIPWEPVRRKGDLALRKMSRRDKKTLYISRTSRSFFVPRTFLWKGKQRVSFSPFCSESPRDRRMQWKKSFEGMFRATCAHLRKGIIKGLCSSHGINELTAKKNVRKKTLFHLHLLISLDSLPDISADGFFIAYLHRASLLRLPVDSSVKHMQHANFRLNNTYSDGWWPFRHQEFFARKTLARIQVNARHSTSMHLYLQIKRARNNTIHKNEREHERELRQRDCVRLSMSDTIMSVTLQYKGNHVKVMKITRTRVLHHTHHD